MRPRTRPAVSVFVVQIGAKTWRISPVSMSATLSLPNRGSAYVAIVVAHCLACLALFKPARCVAI